MVLYIKTEKPEENWLKYILEEFARINGAMFDIKTIDIASISENKKTIYYSIEKQDGTSIYNASNIDFNTEIKHISDNLYIYKHTESSEHNNNINFDLLFNSFLFLSRYEEYISEKNGKLVKSYASRHTRKDKKTFQTPIVNLLFDKLESFIKENFPELKFSSEYNFKIDWSHDVDYIKKNNILRIKQTAFNCYNTIKTISSLKNPISDIKKTTSFLFSNPSYWCFDNWTELECENEINSTFYIFAKTDNRKTDFSKYIIDPNYDISTNIKLQDKLKELIDNGFTIGLHGSYQSATNFELLEEEKLIIEKSLNIKIEKTRQHWLNYSELITPSIHNRLFKFDSTLGWNDQIGFRSGCASAYRIFDHTTNNALDLLEIPQIIMDSNIFDYGRNNICEISNESIQMSSSLKNIKNVNVSLSWHQRVCSSDYKWEQLYFNLIKQLI